MRDPACRGAGAVTSDDEALDVKAHPESDPRGIKSTLTLGPEGLGVVPNPRRRDMLKGLIERSVIPHAENRFDGEGRTQHSISACTHPTGSKSPFFSRFCAASAN